MRAVSLFEVEPPFRSSKVLAHARGQNCTLRFEGRCNGDPATTVSCHISNRHKGMAIKASDHSICFGCSDCHAFLDQGGALGKLGPEVYFSTLLRAMQETYEILIRDGVIGFPHDRRRR